MSRRHSAAGSEQRRWQRVRLTILRRDGYRCRTCGLAGRLEVDHVQPLHKGGARFDPENLAACCRSCHITKTAEENRRYPKPVGADAWRTFAAELR